MENKSFKEIKSVEFVEITDEEFGRLSDLVYNSIGINLTKEKRALLAGRLQKILRKLKLDSFNEYYKYLTNDKSGEALSELANTISTNHTFFGRENEHFEYFKSVALQAAIERAKKQNKRELRIWSAGCSTGEEPYTLVMLMKEIMGMDYSNWDAGVLATDISQKALDIAKAGIYPNEKLINFNPVLKNKYFKKTATNGWEIKNEIREQVIFRRFNLMSPTFPFKKPFDVIFCRNVMIYFDESTRRELVGKFFKFVYPGGHFFIGHSETINKINPGFTYIMPAAYKKDDI